MKIFALLGCLFALGSALPAQAALGTLPPLGPLQLLHRLERFNYTAKWSTTVDSAASTGPLTLEKMTLSYDNRGQERHVKLDVYRDPKFPGWRRPVVILFPPLAGLSKFDTGFAEYFARNGFLAIISEVPKNIEDFSDLDPLLQEFENVTIDNRILVDYLFSRSDVDTQHLNVLGVSLGGIRAGMFHGIEPRIHSTAMVISGGNLPGIMTLSAVESVQELRKRIMAAHQLSSLDEFESFVRERLNWDPVYSSQLRRGDLLMVIGDKDTHVPAAYQVELSQDYAPEVIYHFNFDHIGTATEIYLRKSLLRDFFLR